MRKRVMLIICFLILLIALSISADATKEGPLKTAPRGKKQTKTMVAPNLINDRLFSTFNQAEQNAWVYAINGGKNTNYTHMSLTPSQGEGYSIPDGEGNPVVGSVKQVDFNGENGVSITNNAVPSNIENQVRVGQSITGLQVGKSYTFSINIHSSLATKYSSFLGTKKKTGRVENDGASVAYPSDKNWADLAANQWKTLSYTFTAQDTVLWFYISFQQSGEGVVESLKSPQLRENIPSFSSSSYGTVVDKDGKRISGKAVRPQQQVLSLNYSGSNLANDTTVNNQPLSSTKMFLVENDIVKIKNVGYYQGKSTTLAMKLLTPKATFTASLPINFSGRNGVLRLEFWIEDQLGNEINNDQLAVLFPYKFSYTNEKEGQFLQYAYSSTTNIDNILMLNTSDFDQVTLDVEDDAYRMTSLPISHPVMNFVYRASQHFILDGQFRKEDGGIHTGSMLTTNQFLDSSVPLLVPIIYPVPKLEDTQNESDFQAKLKLSQFLPKENDAFYADPLTLQVDMSKFVKTIGKLSTIKIMDRESNDITNQTVVESKEEGKVEITLTKTLLQQLAENQLSITGSFDLNPSLPDFIKLYNQQDGYFHIPVTAKHNQTKDSSSAEMLVKMPPPEGSAKANKIVTVNTNTANLNPADFVENLRSILPGDEVEAVRFKENVVFDKVEKTQVTVVIRSKLTGVEGNITVPLEVIGELGFKQVPPGLDFGTHKISNKITLIERKDPNWKIDIVNTVSKNWQVKAEATPIKDGEGNISPNALIFKSQNGTESDLTIGQQVIASGDGTNASPVVSWNSGKGILFLYSPGAIKIGSYQSIVTFTLEDTPPDK